MKYLKEYNIFGEYNQDILKSILYILDPIKDIYELRIMSPSKDWIRVIIGEENKKHQLNKFDVINLTPYKGELQDMINCVLDERSDLMINIDAWYDVNDRPYNSDKLDDVLNQSKDKVSIFSFDFIKNMTFDDIY